jgi:hypothetical protein
MESVDEKILKKKKENGEESNEWKEYVKESGAPKCIKKKDCIPLEKLNDYDLDYF